MKGRLTPDVTELRHQSSCKSSQGVCSLTKGLSYSLFFQSYVQYKTPVFIKGAMCVFFIEVHALYEDTMLKKDSWISPHRPSKFESVFSGFCVIVMTNQQTYRHGWKHNPCSKLFNSMWKKKSVDTFSEVITLVWYLSLFQRGDVSHILPTVSPTKQKTPSQLSFLRV